MTKPPRKRSRRARPAITDIDAEQREGTTIQDVIGEDGVMRQEELDDSTEFAFLPRVVSAAQADDVDRVGVELRDGVRCVPGLMGDLPRAVERLR
ncbi:hypothetical protein ACLM5J_01490 [Nocardioides sp. Bht2]|uniref:hypothetical protein n=1 Tax=Nocardioides sp. Bht2 TaxID=3392297 RepID=UPI0039B5A14A